MILMDVNVLVYAFRKDAPEHTRHRDWLQSVVNAPGAYGVSDLVLSGLIRVVTHPKVFRNPTPLADAVAFVDTLRNQPNCRRVNPGDRHWGIFTDLCRQASAKGNLVPDAFLAALAIESGCTWITTDRDFSRFPGLRWQHPFT